MLSGMNSRHQGAASLPAHRCCHRPASPLCKQPAHSCLPGQAQAAAAASLPSCLALIWTEALDAVIFFFFFFYHSPFAQLATADQICHRAFTIVQFLLLTTSSPPCAPTRPTIAVSLHRSRPYVLSPPRSCRHGRRAPPPHGQLASLQLSPS